jgi:hypothetical protein
MKTLEKQHPADTKITITLGHAFIGELEPIIRKAIWDCSDKHRAEVKVLIE